MSADTEKLRSKLSKLSKSFDELELQLDNLFSQSLAETLLGLDTIQQAKMQVIIPYVVYDLVFVYLKSRGIDPMSHPVVKELERVRQYFEKIKDAEESQEKRKIGIDKAAAGRFIKHAIAQAKNATLVDERSESSIPVVASAANSSNEHVPITVTSKMIERAEYEKNIKAMESEEEEELDLFDEEVPQGEGGMDVYDDVVEEIAPQQPTSVGKGKQRMVDEEEPSREEQVVASRRKRPRIDPFTGRSYPLRNL
ncbi:hypothetical protein F5I97DRAFT_1808609 [Phlebopus sp. FC_14]|nr:hypothetical protein F5I97DRAFT_1808609 [Phlebopus sp. FC_14]